MSDRDPAFTADQRFATDLEVADAEAAPARSADSLVVHGMLSMIAPDEPARLEARIGRAIAAVHAESVRTSPIARIGHSAPGLATAQSFRSRHAAWRRRIALAGGGIGIAAVLGFAVLFTPSGQSQSGSQAYAALDSIRAATARTEDRTFRVRIEHTGVRDGARPGAATPRRDAMRDGPRDPRDGPRDPRDGPRDPRDGPRDPRDGPRDPRDRDASRMREGIRDALRERDGVREGELVLGSGGRYTLTWRGPASDRGPGRGLVLTTGFDGREYWAVLPDGTVRTADHPAKLKLPPIFGTEPARDGDDDDAEQLTLDSMLERLERGYEITFADRAPVTGEGRNPLIEVTATRRPGAGRRDRERMAPPPAGARGDRQGPMGDPHSRGLTGPGRPASGGPGPRPGGATSGGPGPRPGGAASGGPGPSTGGPGPIGPVPGGPGPGPDVVRVLADASTFDVERLEARWTSGMTRTMVIERVSATEAPTARPAEWFTPAAHVRSR